MTTDRGQPTQKQIDELRAAGIPIGDATEGVSTVPADVEGVETVPSVTEQPPPTEEELAEIRAAGIGMGGEVGVAPAPTPVETVEPVVTVAEVEPEPAVVATAARVEPAPTVVSEPVVHTTQDFEDTVYATPGAGDQWITEADYNNLPPAQQAIYDEGGYEALVEYMSRPTYGMAAPSLQTRIPISPELQDAWQEYVDSAMVGYEEGQLQPYQVVEKLLADGVPWAVIYAYIMQYPESQRGASVYKFITAIDLRFDTIIAGSDEEQFTSLLELGFIPVGSRFVPGLTETEIQRIQAESVGGTEQAIEVAMSLEPHGWGYQTPAELATVRESVAARGEFINWLMNEAPDNLRIAYLEGGVEGYNVAVADMEKAMAIAIAEQAEFEKVYQRPGVGDQWITKEEYNNLSPQLRLVYDEGGYTALISTQEEERSALEAELGPYVVAEGGYDVARYLRDHDGVDTVLLSYGFTDADIEEARKYNTENPWTYETIQEKWDSAYAAIAAIDPPPEQRGRTSVWRTAYDKWIKKHPELASLQAEYQKLWSDDRVIADPAVSVASFEANFLAVRGDPTDLRTRDRLRNYAASEYARLYGWGTAVGSTAQSAVAFLFSPARVMYPEVILKDITAKEWAIGGAQIALIGAPMLTIPFRGAVGVAGTAARATTIGIQAAAVGIFATVTALDWNYMSPAERVLSVSLNVLILGSILHSAGVVSKVRVGTRNLINKARANFTEVLRSRGVRSVTVSEADDAMQQILRGIETHDVALIKAGEARLQAAMRNRTVPPEIRRMVADGGSYIRNNAVDYQRLIETTRRMNYREIGRAARVGRVSDTQVSNQALRRMVKLSDNELAHVRATQILGLQKLRQNYIRDIRRALESERWSAVKASRAFREHEAAIMRELARLKRLGLTTNQESAILGRLDLAYLRKLAADARRIHMAARLQARESTIQAELERLRRTGMTTNQEQTILRRINEGITRQEAARIRELRTMRAIEQREASIQAELERLQRTGLTTKQEAQIWQRLEDYIRSLERTKLARIKQAQALAEEEARIQAALNELRATGSTAGQRVQFNRRIDALMSQIDKLRVRQQQNAQIMRRLDDMFDKVNSTAGRVSSTDATLADIQRYLREKPVEPTVTDIPDEVLPPERGVGVIVKERVRLKPETKAPTRQITEVRPVTRRAVRVSVRPATRTDLRTRKEIGLAIDDPEVQAIAYASLAGVGLPIGRPGAVPLGVPDRGVAPRIAPTVAPIRIPEPSMVPRRVPSVAPSEIPSREPRPLEVVSPALLPVPTPLPAPGPQPLPMPEPRLWSEPRPRPELRPKPTTLAPRPTPTKIWPFLRPRVPSVKPKPQRVPKGSVAFAFGKRKGARGKMVAQWYYIPPPYDMDKPLSLSTHPLGAMNTGSASPYDTIQVIGGGRVPENISIDMGVVDAFITSSGREISFGGKGLRTDVGPRLPSTTVGMGTGESGGEYVDEELVPGVPVSVQEVKRQPRKVKATPKVRKVRQKDDYSDLLWPRGMRP